MYFKDFQLSQREKHKISKTHCSLTCSVKAFATSASYAFFWCGISLSIAAFKENVGKVENMHTVI